MKDVRKLETFMKLLHDVERVKRVAQRPDETEYTSTAEHTFELVLMCWYIMQTDNLDLNHQKVFMYALAHDLVEGWAGDTYIGDAAGQATKSAREHAAKEKMKKTFMEFPELIEAIESYEKREDPESIFVYAADKLIDPLNASMETKPTYWKKQDLSFKETCDYKDEKIAPSDAIQPYWEQVRKKLGDNESFYFNT